MLRHVAETTEHALAHLLQKQRRRYEAFGVTPTHRLRAALRPGDVLLVEGNQRFAAAVKVLTRSTWSHAAFFTGGPADAELIEADLDGGVRRAGLGFYARLNTRICRPVGLTGNDLGRVVGYMEASLGRSYDLKNVVDLARHLWPRATMSPRFRQMFELGSGDPERVICSTLIAAAFQSVGYPILPDIQHRGPGPVRREVLHPRHPTLFAPRDFDLSPYFAVIKPTLEAGFDYRAVDWAERDGRPTPAP